MSDTLAPRRGQLPQPDEEPERALNAALRSDMGPGLDPIRMEPPTASEGLKAPSITEGLQPVSMSALRGQAGPEAGPGEQAALEAAKKRAAELRFE